MKDLEYYMSLPYRMEIVQDKDGIFTAYYPDLRGCMTTATSIEQIVKNALDAKKCWLMACIEDNIEIPEPSEVAFAG